MNKKISYLLCAIFAASVSVTSCSEEKKKNLVEDQSSLFEGLRTEEGLRFDDEMMGRKYPLVFFGTAYKSPACDGVFGMHQLALGLLEDECPDLVGNILPVFIYPETQGSNQDRRSVDDARRAGFLVLHADLNIVESLIEKFDGMYLNKDMYGDPQNHTNFFELLTPEGERISSYNGKWAARRSIAYIKQGMAKEGIECSMY